MRTSARRKTGTPLRICLVHPVQSPYWTARLRVLGKRTDLDITLLLERASFEHRPGWAPEPIDGIRTEVLGSSVRRARRDGRDLGYVIDGVWSIPWRLPFRLMRLRPDVLVVCNATQLILALAVRWLFRFRLALIVEDTEHAARNLPALNRVGRAWAYRCADLYCPFSNDAESYLRSIGISSNMLRTSWSVDMDAFGANAAASAPGGDDNLRIKTAIYVGQFVERKGVGHLIESWAALPKELHQRARLVMYGTGSLREGLAERCRAEGLMNVEFPGHAPYEQVIQALGTADLFILPTVEDLFSLTVLEAMASGCAVITTPYNGARELIDEGRNGWIADPIVPGALRDAIERALGPETDLARMGVDARQRVQGMDNEIVMERFARDLHAASNHI